MSTAAHVYRGLVGMFILDDTSSSADLPHIYGTDDIPVIVQDKSFTSNAQLDDRQPLLSPTGFLAVPAS